MAGHAWRSIQTPEHLPAAAAIGHRHTQHTSHGASLAARKRPPARARPHTHTKPLRPPALSASLQRPLKHPLHPPSLPLPRHHLRPSRPIPPHPASAGCTAMRERLGAAVAAAAASPAGATAFWLAVATAASTYCAYRHSGPAFLPRLPD